MLKRHQQTTDSARKNARPRSIRRRWRRRRPLGCTGWMIILAVLCAAAVVTSLAMGQRPNLMP